MNEGIKTLVYLGVAGLVAILAIVSRPPVEKFNVGEQAGKFLFEKFDDPAKADSMEIVRYDETLGTIEEFRVARDKASGAWTLPKFSSYPADAESRVRDAALLLVELPIVGVASEVAGDHRMFGVIEPDKEKLKVGDEGVGLLVRFEDAKGQDLASVIVGKKVSGADGHRYVRKVGQDVVYDVKIDPDQLSTKFKDWIDKDLLKMNAFDVENVALKNYAVSLQPPNRVLIDKRFDLTADFKDSEWKLKELKKYRDGEGLVTTLSENEELNKEKLNDLKTAVDELEIADVRRKPKGLGADLKAGAGMAKDDEGMVDLMKHGFYMVPMRGSETEFELLSANGEITVGMKEGVEYVLRFGETEEGGQTAEGEGQNRYLFVTTRVDMSKFPQPDLEPVPELPGAAKPEAGKEPKAETPKGFRDYFGAEVTERQEMLATIAEVYRMHGFDPLETSAVETVEALGKFLPDVDRPNAGVFSFQDDDEQWLSLRYDLTAPLARYVAENQQFLPTPFRSYRQGWVFRNEKPGPGRYRQFMQFDADTVGSASPVADAEVCMMAADTMEALGLSRGQ